MKLWIFVILLALSHLVLGGDRPPPEEEEELSTPPELQSVADVNDILESILGRVHTDDSLENAANQFATLSVHFDTYEAGRWSEMLDDVEVADDDSDTEDTDCDDLNSGENLNEAEEEVANILDQILEGVYNEVNHTRENGLEGEVVGEQEDEALVDTNEGDDEQDEVEQLLFYLAEDEALVDTNEGDNEQSEKLVAVVTEDTNNGAKVEEDNMKEDKDEDKDEEKPQIELKDKDDQDKDDDKNGGSQNANNAGDQSNQNDDHQNNNGQNNNEQGDTNKEEGEEKEDNGTEEQQSQNLDGFGLLESECIVNIIFKNFGPKTLFRNPLFWGICQ